MRQQRYRYNHSTVYV